MSKNPTAPTGLAALKAAAASAPTDTAPTATANVAVTVDGLKIRATIDCQTIRPTAPHHKRMQVAYASETVTVDGIPMTVQITVTGPKNPAFDPVALAAKNAKRSK